MLPRSGLPSFLQRIPPVTLNLLGLNLLVYILMSIIPAMDISLTRHLALYYPTAPNFGVYQLITYQFLHAGFGHLFFNMFALLMFGGIIERTMGSARFLFYYLSCGIFAGLVQMGVFALIINHLGDFMTAEQYHYALYDMYRDAMTSGYASMPVTPEMYSVFQYVATPMVGASGAIYGVLLAFGMLFPNQPIYMMFIPIPIKAKWLIVGYFILELIYGVTGSAQGVAHFAHLGGMIFGFFMILYWKRRGVFNNHWFF